MSEPTKKTFDAITGMVETMDEKEIAILVTALNKKIATFYEPKSLETAISASEPSSDVIIIDDPYQPPSIPSVQEEGTEIINRSDCGEMSKTSGVGDKDGSVAIYEDSWGTTEDDPKEIEDFTDGGRYKDILPLLEKTFNNFGFQNKYCPKGKEKETSFKRFGRLHLPIKKDKKVNQITNLAMLIDVSGSMRGHDILQAIMIVKNITKTWRISKLKIFFVGERTFEIDPQKVLDFDRTSKAFRELKGKNDAALGCGEDFSLEEISRAFPEGYSLPNKKNGSVIVFSDYCWNSNPAESFRNNITKNCNVIGVYPEEDDKDRAIRETGITEVIQLRAD